MSTFRSQPSVRGMVVNNVSQLSTMDIDFLKQEYPATDFSRVLLIEEAVLRPGVTGASSPAPA